MALGIYKSGYGYWVRVLTASMAALLVLGFGAWAWGQAKVIASRLPKTSWVMTIGEPTGPIPDAGQAVTLVAPIGLEAEPTAIGTARVTGFDNAAKALSLSEVEITNENASDASSARRISVKGADGTELFSAPVNQSAGFGFIEPLYLQGGVTAVILVVGTILIYWLCAIKQNSCEFLIATDMEMKKVNWSTRKDIIGSTWVVITWSLIIAAFLFFCDICFQAFFSAINVLQAV